MRAGELDRRISIERRTDVRDAFGQPVATWTRIGEVRWAKRKPVRGSERYTADQFIAREQIEFWIRWTQDLASLNPKDRIVYPVTSTPADYEIYEIIAVEEIGRREGFKVMTARRSEG